MPKISIGDAEIHYERQGSGPPLLVSPGLGGVGGIYRPQLPIWTRGFDVILYDHRGAGQSTASNIKYSVAQMAADAVKLLDALGIKKAHFLGHSTGGAIGQHLALDYPDRIGALVLSGTWPKSDNFFVKSFEARKRVLADSGIEAYAKISSLVLFPPWFHNEHAKQAEEIAAGMAKGFSSREILLSRVDAIIAHDRLKDLPRIKHRTLVIAAEDDYVTPFYHSQKIAQLIPGALLRSLGTGGHMIMLTMADIYGRQVYDWLTSLDHR